MPVVLWTSVGVATGISAVLTACYWGDVTAFEVTGFFMTAWALGLALAIYVAQNAEPGELVRELEASNATLRGEILGEEPLSFVRGDPIKAGPAGRHSQEKKTRQSMQTTQETPEVQEDLAAKIKQYEGHVKHLLMEYPKLPREDITYVDRPKSNNGPNPPVVVKTKRGHTYSVFHGGRNGNWYVTDLSGS
jgi:hypothetical protein